MANSLRMLSNEWETLGMRRKRWNLCWIAILLIFPPEDILMVPISICRYAELFSSNSSKKSKEKKYREKSVRKNRRIN